MNHDKNAAKAYIGQLTGNENSVVTFQTFWDSKTDKEEFAKKMKSNGKKPYDPKAKIIVGKIDDLWDQLRARNEGGAGVFAAINEMMGNARNNQSVTKIRTLAADNDGDGIEVEAQECSFTVISKRGNHSYWNLQENLKPEEFKKYQRRIAERLGTDKSISDCARVLRVPGFFHMKDARAPFPISLGTTSQRKYTIEEIEKIFPEQSKSKLRNSINFLKWVKTLPIAEGDENKLGGRNRTIVILSREGLAQGYSVEELESHVLSYCERSGCSPEEGIEVLYRQARYHSEEPFHSVLKDKSDKDFFRIATDFAKLKYGDGKKIISLMINEELFHWEKGIYVPYPKNTLKYDVTKYFQEQGGQVNNSIINNVVTQVEGAIHVKESIKAGQWFDGRNAETFQISLRNGLFVPSHVNGPK